MEEAFHQGANVKSEFDEEESRQRSLIGLKWQSYRQNRRCLMHGEAREWEGRLVMILAEEKLRNGKAAGDDSDILIEIVKAASSEDEFLSKLLELVHDI